MNCRVNSLSLSAIYGERAAERFAWLEATAGYHAVQKFIDGKVGGPGFSGQYVIGICGSDAGRDLICNLLDALKNGGVISLYDINSYYARGRRRPIGMQLVHGELTDVWEIAHTN